MDGQRQRTVITILKRFRTFRYILLLEGIAVGILSGLVTVLFRLALEHAEELLQLALSFGREHIWFIAVWFLLLGILSVSYTHLDVYKRQLRGFPYIVTDRNFKHNNSSCLYFHYNLSWLIKQVMEDYREI